MAEELTIPTEAELDDQAPRADGWADVMQTLAAEAPTLGQRFRARAKLTDLELSSIFRQDWLSKESIERRAQDMVKSWVKFTFSGMDPTAASKLAEAVQDKLDSFGTAGFDMTVYEALCWADLYGGAVIVLGVDDGQEDQTQPVREDAVQDVTWAQVFEAPNCPVWDWDRDPASRTFGQPRTYRIVNQYAGTVTDFHSSRVVRIPGPLTPTDAVIDNGGWEDSVLESQFAPIQGYHAGMAGAAKALEKFSVDKFKQKDLSRNLASKNGMDAIRSRAMALKMGMKIGNVAMIDAELEDYEITGRPVSGMSDLIDRMNRNTSGALSIPESRLFGQAQGTARAGAESDDTTYHADVAFEQKRRMLPAMRRIVSLILRSKRGPTKGKEPERWKIVPVPLGQPTRRQAAEIRKLDAEANKIDVDAGVLDPLEVRLSVHGEGQAGITLDDDVTESMKAAANDLPPDTGDTGGEGNDSPLDRPPDDDTGQA